MIRVSNWLFRVNININSVIVFLLGIIFLLHINTNFLLLLINVLLINLNQTFFIYEFLLQSSWRNRFTASPTESTLLDIKQQIIHFKNLQIVNIRCNKGNKICYRHFFTYMRAINTQTKYIDKMLIAIYLWATAYTHITYDPCNYFFSRFL